ncbi:MAG TPA: NAD(P)-dependent oxidoreductase [Stellaceae bacterium]|nr:NAD(P)-dependent oxidoreductase [Stellaceae bacterium]
MATLVIGAGLVGSQVARLLVERGETTVVMDAAPQPDALGEIVDLARVTLVEGDVLRPFALLQIVRDNDVTEIVHTAANPLLTTGAQRDPFAAIQLNIMGTVNVLEAARVMKLRRVVVSSSNVLSHYLAGGEGKGDLAKEEALPRPQTFYATTKQAIENLGLNYARWCGVDFAAVRYGAVAGPWSGRGGGGPSNAFRDAVINAVKGEEAVVPPGAMEWVYSKDAAAGTALALGAKALPQRVFNITMGSVTSPQEFARALKDAVPGAKIRIADPPGAGVSLMDMRHTSDLTLARDVLGYAPRFGIDEAVRDMVAWCRSNARGRRSA